MDQLLRVAWCNKGVKQFLDTAGCILDLLNDLPVDALFNIFAGFSRTGGNLKQDSLCGCTILADEHDVVVCQKRHYGNRSSVLDYFTRMRCAIGRPNLVDSEIDDSALVYPPTTYLRL